MTVVVQIVVVLLLRPLFVILYRPRVSGEGLRPRDLSGTTLFVANHVSYVDAFLMVLLPFRIHRKVLPIYFPTTSMYMDRWYYRMLIAPMGAYTMRRWSASLDEYMSQTLEHIELGHTVLLFPEGRLVPEGERSKGRPGVGLLRDVYKDLHVVPIKIKFEKSKFWPFPKLHLIMGKEVSSRINGGSVEDYQNYADHVLDEIYSL